MELNVVDRINILGVLPKEGNALTLKIVRDLQDSLTLTEEEYNEFVRKRTLPDGRIVDDLKPDKINATKDVKIGAKANEIITEALKSLDEKKELHITLLSLYERFVENSEKVKS
jgi:hypothetical protein